MNIRICYFFFDYSFVGFISPLTCAWICVQFEEMDYFAGILCEVWKNVTAFGHKKNTYRLWVAQPEGGTSLAKPYHYEMMGYNTLLGSHYDKYLIDYSDFIPQTDPKDFSLPDGKFIFSLLLAQVCAS